MAGSEKAGQTGAVGQRLKEGGHINASLLALSHCINKLAEAKRYSGCNMFLYSTDDVFQDFNCVDIDTTDI